MLRIWRWLFLSAIVGTSVSAQGDEAGTIQVTIQHHRFEPAEIMVPSGKPLTLRVRNLDAHAEEFESHLLKVEKVIAGKGEGTIHLHALEPGRYAFVGEYHSDFARGVLIAE